MKMQIGIAGINLAISSVHDGLLNRLSGVYQDFRSSGEPDLVIEVYIEEASLKNVGYPDTQVIFEPGVLRFSAPGYHGYIDEKCRAGELWVSAKHPSMQVDYIARLAYSLLALEKGGFLFHGAGVLRNQQVYVFYGPSGSGKTTIANMSSDTIILNDDLLLLMPIEEVWYAYATPFWNPTQVKPTTGFAPIAGLYRLVKDTGVSLVRMNSSLAMAEILANIPVAPLDSNKTQKIIPAITALLEHVPAYRLHFKKDNTFWNAVDK